MTIKKTSFKERLGNFLMFTISFWTFFTISIVVTVIFGFFGFRYGWDIGIVATAIPVFSFATVFLSALSREIDLQAKDEVRKIEDKLKKEGDTDKTILTWELGRKVLESYLERDLRHVKWIFMWTVLVIFVGFGIIIYGIINAYNGNVNISTNLLTVSTGLLIQFIGASFLLVYRSTSKQAKDYVGVLERINAVGMSVQILDSISSEREILKDETKAELSKKLLDLYAVSAK